MNRGYLKRIKRLEYNALLPYEKQLTDDTKKKLACGIRINDLSTIARRAKISEQIDEKFKNHTDADLLALQGDDRDMLEAMSDEELWAIIEENYK